MRKRETGELFKSLLLTQFRKFWWPDRIGRCKLKLIVLSKVSSKGSISSSRSGFDFGCDILLEIHNYTDQWRQWWMRKERSTFFIPNIIWQNWSTTNDVRFKRHTRTTQFFWGILFFIDLNNKNINKMCRLCC